MDSKPRLGKRVSRGLDLLLEDLDEMLPYHESSRTGPRRSDRRAALTYLRRLRQWDADRRESSPCTTTTSTGSTSPSRQPAP